AKRELLSSVRSSINFPICKLVAVNRELDLPISGADFQWAGLLITIRRECNVPDGHPQSFKKKFHKLDLVQLHANPLAKRN
ncbi:MAG: hypothetical protein K5769_11590, partial [Pseudobutyrivibrio sp.]|nr:hypothetical protein [Pseudobutyrivibrio sp.]